MNVSARIKKISEFVECDTLCDIGTDHALLPILLAKAGKLRKCAACDINANPLRNAEKNIKAEGFCGILETRLGGGLAPIRCCEFDCCVIAGMGGLLITEILQADMEKACAFKQLILSPHRDAHALRHFLYDNLFQITNERLLYDAEKWYVIINCAFIGENDAPYTEAELFFGKKEIKINDENFSDYLKYEKDKAQKVLKKAGNFASSTQVNFLKYCEEALNWG